MALCSRFESGAKWERERDGVVAWLVQWGRLMRCVWSAARRKSRAGNGAGGRCGRMDAMARRCPVRRGEATRGWRRETSSRASAGLTACGSKSADGEFQVKRRGQPSYAGGGDVTGGNSSFGAKCLNCVGSVLKNG